jgi:oligoribonuclease
MTELYWVALETTGLDPRNDQILEIAVSRARLDRPFDAEPVFHQVFHHDGRGLSPFFVEMHTKNGLLAECAKSTASLYDAFASLNDVVPLGGGVPPVIAGSTIYFDLEFLKNWVPAIGMRFHHRTYDVSAVKLFCESLGMPRIPKGEAHRAREDVLESIAHASMCAAWLRRLP